MKIKLIRRNFKFIDGSGNSRMNTTITLLTAGHNNVHQYSSPSLYRLWLRSILDESKAKMKDVEYEYMNKDIPGLHNSFYTLIFSKNYGWSGRFLIPLNGNHNRAELLNTRHYSLDSAIILMKTLPENHDFELLTSAGRRLYEMTDDNMILALLKWPNI